jgi:hypothetical protein
LTAPGKGVNLLVSTGFARFVPEGVLDADSQPIGPPPPASEAQVQ